MKPIFLIGYMGCGKTTLGRAVAARARVRFVDLDEYVEEQAGCTVRDIFEREGEAEFRRREREALAEMAELAGSNPSEALLVACGGGTPCQPGAMELMNAVGTTVMLATSHSRLLARLVDGAAKRPLIAGKSEAEISQIITAGLAARMPHYSKAAHTFDSTFLETDQQVASTAHLFIKQFSL